MTEIAVRARGLSKAYREDAVVTEVLRGIDLDVAAGDLVAIVGPSGSGKSTLLHLLGALDRPDAGEIEIGGRDLGTLDRNQLADLRNATIGFVFQFHQLLPDWSALENVMMPGLIGGLGQPELERRAAGLLEEVGLGARLGAFPNQLSGGERQRVALCRALVMEPPILLADEPTGNLDPASGERVLGLLLAMRERRGTTTLLVTHNPEIANRCARVLTLMDGRIAPR